MLCCPHDILFARSGGLDHLVHGAICLIDKAVAESKGEIVNNLSFSIGKEFPVVAVRRDEPGIIDRHREDRSYRTHESYIGILPDARYIYNNITLSNNITQFTSSLTRSRSCLSSLTLWSIRSRLKLLIETF